MVLSPCSILPQSITLLCESNPSFGLTTVSQAAESESNKITEADLDLSLEVGADTEGNLVCKFNLFVMPGMPRSWCVVDVKRWKMMATCCGDLNCELLSACHRLLR